MVALELTYMPALQLCACLNQLPVYVTYTCNHFMGSAIGTLFTTCYYTFIHYVQYSAVACTWSQFIKVWPWRGNPQNNYLFFTRLLHLLVWNIRSGHVGCDWRHFDRQGIQMYLVIAFPNTTCRIEDSFYTLPFPILLHSWDDAIAQCIDCWILD